MTRGWILTTLALYSLTCAVKPEDRQASPSIRHIVFPAYTAKARLSGAEGTVVVPLSLDKDCHASGGPKADAVSSELQDAVYRTVVDGLQFSDCSAGFRLEFAFHFALSGPPTNGWSPTRIQQTGPYAFTITTQPPDLEELNLQRRSKTRVRDDTMYRVEPSSARWLSFSDAERTPLIFPEYPPLARQAGVQGDVSAKAMLAKDCQVFEFEADGEVLLRSAVEQAFRRLPITNRNCNPGNVHAKFRFKLDGDKIPDGAPTRLEISSPDTVVVSTNPPGKEIVN